MSSFAFLRCHTSLHLELLNLLQYSLSSLCSIHRIVKVFQKVSDGSSSALCAWLAEEEGKNFYLALIRMACAHDSDQNPESLV